MKNYCKIALFLLMLTACVCNVQAQDNKRHWTKEMLDYKHEFIVKETAMTQAQRTKFMPLYEAMEKEIFSVYRNARDQAKKVNSNRKVSDDDYLNAAKAMSEVKYKVGEIETRYFNQFAKILSKKQLFILKKAEVKFTRDVVGKKKK
jgi:Spy/CpxP family protein refolding chaperone